MNIQDIKKLREKAEERGKSYGTIFNGKGETDTYLKALHDFFLQFVEAYEIRGVALELYAHSGKWEISDDNDSFYGGGCNGDTLDVGGRHGYEVAQQALEASKKLEGHK